MKIYVDGRDARSFVGPVSKERFQNVTSLCLSNLANLNLKAAVLQLRRSRGEFGPTFCFLSYMVSLLSVEVIMHRGIRG